MHNIPVTFVSRWLLVFSTIKMCKEYSISITFIFITIVLHVYFKPDRYWSLLDNHNALSRHLQNHKKNNSERKSLIGFNQCKENLRLTITTTALMTIIFPTE